MVVLEAEVADYLVKEELSDDCQRNDVLDPFHGRIPDLCCCEQNNVVVYCWGVANFGGYE
jgi:hypothetical protein